MADQSLQVIHIPNEPVDPLLSFESEWELAMRSTRPTDVVAVTSQQAPPKKVHVSERPRKPTVPVADRSAIVKRVSLFVSGAVAGAVLTLLFSGDSSGTAGTDEVQRVTTVVSAPPKPAPVIEPVSVGMTGSRAAEPVDSGVYRGSLRVTSEPAGAGVFINDSFAGRTPLVIRTMPVGSRAVRVTLDGYASWSRGVRIVANESTTVAAQLHPTKTRP